MASQRVDLVTTPFPVDPLQQAHIPRSTPHTLEYNEDSTQAGRGNQQYTAHSPAVTQTQEVVDSPQVSPTCQHSPQMAAFKNSPPLVTKTDPAQTPSEGFLGQANTPSTPPLVSPTHRHDHRSCSFSDSFNDSDSMASIEQPLDPNLVCLKCGLQFRQGEIQKYRAHYKSCTIEHHQPSPSDVEYVVSRQSPQATSSSHTSESTALHQSYTFQNLNSDGMKHSRSFSDSFNDSDSMASIEQPLDPNLVCLKCGLQFRQGEIQKYRAHYKSCTIEHHQPSPSDVEYVVSRQSPQATSSSHTSESTALHQSYTSQHLLKATMENGYSPTKTRKLDAAAETPLSAQKNFTTTIPFAPPQQMLAYKNSPPLVRKTLSPASLKEVKTPTVAPQLSPIHQLVYYSPAQIRNPNTPQAPLVAQKQIPTMMPPDIAAQQMQFPLYSNPQLQERKLEQQYVVYQPPSHLPEHLLSTSRPNVIQRRHNSKPTSQNRKYIKFTQSEGTTSPFLEIPKMGERLAHSESSPPLLVGSSVLDMDSVADAGPRFHPLLQQLNSDGMKRSRSFSDSFNDSDSMATIEQPLDPNLVCLKCGLQFRQGEIQKFRKHAMSCTIEQHQPSPSDDENVVSRQSPHTTSSSHMSESSALHQKYTSQHLLKAAMKKGRVKARISTVLLHGPAGSGKTCSMCLLVGEDPPAVRYSTAVAARPMRMFRFDVSHDVWRKLTPQQRRDVLARAVKSQPKQVDINPKEEEDPDTGILQGDSEAVSPPQSSVADIPDLTTADELADLIDQCSGESPLLQLDMMHIIDTGGQPQCHELMRYFVKRSISLYVFVFKLSEEFCSRPLIAYYDESGKCVSGDQRTTQTNEQILQQCVRTVQSHKRANQRVKMLFLGTHEDQEACCPEPRMAKNKKLIKMIPQNFLDDLIYYNLPTNELIFPVNASLPGPHEKELVSHIRKLISTQCISEDFDLPLQWYGLEIILEELSERLERKVMHRSECLAASKMLHLTEADFNAAVDYLDEHCLIFYFRDILPQLVFSDVQVLLDKATELVEASCEVRRQNPTQPCVRDGRWKKFHELGIVTCDFLSQDRFKKHYVPGIFTPVELTELFRKLHIFADLENEQYFMPSLLESLSSVDLQPHRVSASAATLSPLVLPFPNGGPQLGVFCYVIAYLLSSENSSPSAWKLKMKDDGITPECLKRNCVLFVIPKMSGSVSLVDSFHHLEVHVDGVPQFRSRKCARTILQALLHGLTKANERLGYSDVPPELGLACPCKEGEFHHATMVVDDDDDDDSCWICSKNRSKCEQLLPNQSVWPKESHTVVASEVVHTSECSGSPPSENKVDPQQVAELTALLGPVAACWGLFLGQLGVQKHKQDEIALNNANKPNFAQVCLQDGLHLWVNSTDRPTYQRIAEVLRGNTVTNKILADKVERFAATQSTLH